MPYKSHFESYENLFTFNSPRSTIMRKLFLLIISTILSFTLLSQQLLVDVVDSRLLNPDLVLGKNKSVNGSPYLFDDFMKGSVILLSGSEFNDLRLQLDIYQNDLILKKDSSLISLNTKSIDRFVLYPENLPPMIFKKAGNTFEELIVDDETIKISLVHKKKIVRGSPGNGYSEGTKDRFELVTQGHYSNKQERIAFNSSKDLVRKLVVIYPLLKEEFDTMQKSPRYKKSDEKHRLEMIAGVFGWVAK